MKMRKRLLCLGAAFSILCSHVAFGEEVVPPHPLSGGLPGASGTLGQGPGGVNGQTIGNVTTGGLPAPGGNGAAPGGNVLPAGSTLQAGGGTQGDGGTAQGAGSTVSQSAGGSGAQTGGGASQGTGDISAPVVAAEGAVLLDCRTGQVLFGKNEDTQFYPASITKVMTALLTIENCSLQDTVTFSQAATTNLESGAVTLDLTAGDQLTVEQCLYALLLKSANEVANGLAEHISGSVSAFADKMNARAAQLGCTGTHFANPNGLNNAAHLTTPHDMALIARAAYADPTLSKISTTTSYQIPATIKGGAKTVTMGHKMVYPTDSRYYPGMVGGKTGYTSKAGNTLVTCVEKDGTRLVAVVMKASGTHYTDTKAMLDYGFALAAAGKLPGGTSENGAAQGAAGAGGLQGMPSGNGTAGPGAAGGQGGGAADYSQGPGAAASGIKTGWVQVGTDWYHYQTSGEMTRNAWVKSKEKWYYLGADGVMLTNTTTPDGYTVGADGAWQ